MTYSAKTDPQRRRQRRATGPLAPLVLVLTLAGCSVGEEELPPPCPTTFPVAEARELTRFVGQGRDLTDILFEAQFLDVVLACAYDDGVIEMDMAVRIMAADGPANQGRNVRLAYFVAIATWDRKIVAREEFEIEIPFEGNRTRVVAVDAVSPRIPLQPGQTGADYVIYVGLALTQAELRYNQENR
ncbi:MAG: hypothetical protein ACTSQ7_05400 [Alphaproteobacteria bacterium]